MSRQQLDQAGRGILPRKTCPVVRRKLITVSSLSKRLEIETTFTSLSHDFPRPLLFWVLGRVKPRDVIYTKTKLRTPRQTSPPEDRYIVLNAYVQPTASSAAIPANIESSLGAPVSSRIIRRRLGEGHLRSRHPLRALRLMLTHRCLRLEWWRALRKWNGNRSSLATNPD
ncbi:HTH_Tnp_Tc3_2 domain-containing protein [Trichonephila clavipes]|nr:HTH_Tnp_Tc3_2 domain-containing protein [Trichonephila clavipes]